MDRGPKREVRDAKNGGVVGSMEGVCFCLSTGLAGIREQQGERNKRGQERNEK